MTLALEFRQNLEGRKGRNHFEKLYGRFTGNSREGYVKEMLNNIRQRCDQLCQLQDDRFPPPFIRWVTDSTEQVSRDAFGIVNSLKGTARGIACDILCIESDRLEMLNSKLNGNTGEGDKKLLENAYAAFANSVSKTPPEINYRAAVVIEDEIALKAYKIEKFLYSYPHASKHIEDAKSDLQSLRDKWKERSEWVRNMIYPQRRNSQELADQWFRDGYNGFVNTTQNIQRFDESISRTFHLEQTANTYSPIASSSSQGMETGSLQSPWRDRSSSPSSRDSDPFKDPDQ